MRLFIATPVTPEIREAVAKVIDSVKAGLSSSPVKWVGPDHLHLTFRFLGETPNTDLGEITKRLLGVCGSFQPLEIAVGGLGCFPGFDRPKVIWLGLAGPRRLAALQEAIAGATAGFGDQIKLPKERAPTFLPHLTLGRVRDIPGAKLRCLGRELQRQIVGKTGVWRLDRVAVIKSELGDAGPTYTELASIPLAAV